MRTILDLTESNERIKTLIQKGDPFLVSRIGLGGESLVSALTLNNSMINDAVKQWFYVNAGFYGTDNYRDFAILYKKACESGDLHAYWNNDSFRQVEDFLVPQNKTLVDPSVLESFRCRNPWTSELKGKKILIVHPFKKTIDEQLKVKNKLWNDEGILPDATYITYQSVQSIGGIGPHKDWYESLNIMFDDISKIDFDIVFLGCGAYGMPLSYLIKEKLKRSAIYIGGGLQLYFGIKGLRWDNGDTSNYYNEFWVRPDLVEKPQHSLMVEGGCYW
jgi:hypothetical protein